MGNFDLPIRSRIHRVHYARPVLFWFIVNFIAACACSPGEKEYGYHYEIFFSFLAYSTLIIFSIGFIYIITRKTLTLENDRIVCKRLYRKSKTMYRFTDILDFKWGNRAAQANTRYGGQARLKNEVIELGFKNQEPLLIRFDQYQNFDLIKKFLFHYCIQHRIISIRPLEERKRSHQKAPRKTR